MAAFPDGPHSSLLIIWQARREMWLRIGQEIEMERRNP